MQLLLVLADMDPISGGAGWVGAGLLGAVLAWLMFIHLPAKDKQVTGLIEGRNELSENLQNRYSASIKELQAGMAQISKEQREDHKQVVQMVMEHCRSETEHIAKSMADSMSEVTQAVLDLRRMMEESSERK